MGIFFRRKLQNLFFILVGAMCLSFTLSIVYELYWLHSRDFKIYSNFSGILGNSNESFEDFQEKNILQIGEENVDGKSRKVLEDESGGKNEHTNAFVSGLVNNRTVKLSDNNNSTSYENQLQKKELAVKTKESLLDTSINAKDRGLRANFWRGIDLPNLKALCDHPLFPKGPSERSVVDKLEIQRKENYFAQQILGYLYPSITGLHTFAVASDDNSEVWLREEGSNKTANKICSVEGKGDDLAWTRADDFDKYPSQKSKPVHLEKGKKYYLEVLHIQSIGNDIIKVAWLLPGATNFTVIDSKSTSLVDGVWNVSVRTGRGGFATDACTGIAEHHHIRTGRNLTIDRPRYIEHKKLENALPVCPYRPEYVNREGPLPGEQWYFLSKYRVPTYRFPRVEYSRVYGTSVFGNHPLEYKEADSIVKEYMDRVQKEYPGVYKLRNIIKVEKKHNKDKGARYLVELNVTKDSNHSTFVISEYIYKNSTSKTLCYPENFQWQRHAKNALIISVRNQGVWMRHFLDNLEEIYVSTGEKNISVIVFDYESNDINLEKEIRARNLPPHMIIKKAGLYSRSESINAAVRAVKDPHTIVFTLDLHLEIPNTVLDEVRKHCFEGRSVYTPVILRLKPGHSPANIFGFWEQQGYGLLAMYKSDWDRIGGLNEEKFKNKWGGEDWEIMDIIVDAGMEHERVREFKMFHFSHSKKGMWTGDDAIEKQ